YHFAQVVEFVPGEIGLVEPDRHNGSSLSLSAVRLTDACAVRYRAATVGCIISGSGETPESTPLKDRVASCGSPVFSKAGDGDECEHKWEKNEMVSLLHNHQQVDPGGTNQSH